MNTKTLMLVDYDSVADSIIRQQLNLNPAVLASKLSQFVKLLDPQAEKEAFGAWENYEERVDANNRFIPRAENAFKGEGFETKKANSRGLARRIRAVSRDYKDCERLILVTVDDRLVVDIESTIDEFQERARSLDVSVWGTGETPVDLRSEVFNFIDLQDHLEELKRSTVAMVIDLENIAIEVLKKGRYDVDLRGLVEIINSLADQKGHVISRTAYADYGTLARILGLDAGEMQSLLESSGITTRYVPLNAGKNSSDMKIANDLKALADNPTGRPDEVLLVSSDRDFSTPVAELKRRGCKVTVLGMHNATSYSMAEMQFLDDSLPRLEDTPSSLKIPKPSKPPMISKALAPEVRAIAAISERIRQMGWRWVSLVNAQRTLVDLGMSPEESEETIDDVKVQGILKATDAGNSAYVIDTAHPVANTVLTILGVIRNRMSYTHRTKGFTKIREGFILRGLAMDKRLQEAEITLSPQAGVAWLELAVTIDILSCETVDDEQRPGNTVRVYWLNQPVTPLPSAGVVDVGVMLKRLVTVADQFMAVKSMNWIPMKLLDAELSKFGRSTYFEAVKTLEAEGAVSIEKHENSRAGGYPVTGLALNGETASVGQIRKARQHVVAQLLELSRNDVAITAASLTEAMANDSQPMPEDECAQWLDVLNGSLVLTRLPGAQATYGINTNHMLVRVETIEPAEEPKPSGWLQNLQSFIRPATQVA